MLRNFSADKKPSGYYSTARDEMLRFIPKGTKCVLEIGCGEGVFGIAVKKMSGAEVWGVEINKDVASTAKGKLDNVLAGDVSILMPDLPDSKFDCIVFNDVLEHLADPRAVLAAARKKLCPGGVVVCSLPNVRYFPVLRQLLINKQWRYVDWGVLDRTHLRFFTEKSILTTFEELGYNVIRIEGINGFRSWKFTLLNAGLFGQLSDARYMQFACVAKIS